jgi:hypothetical protein
MGEVRRLAINKSTVPIHLPDSPASIIPSAFFNGQLKFAQMRIRSLQVKSAQRGNTRIYDGDSPRQPYDILKCGA